MKIVLDTNVIIAASISAHVDHQLAFSWLDSCQVGTHQGVISNHTLLEVYSVLTKYPIRPKISAIAARDAIERNIRPYFEIVPFTVDDYWQILAELAQEDILGGTAYDALIARAAMNSGADAIVTYNQKHLRRVLGRLPVQLIVP